MKRLLLVCGILSSFLYGAMITFVRYDGYSLLSHTVSELTAIGAPTRPLWLWLGPLYDVLLLAFGVGVWRSAGSTRVLRVIAGLLIVLGMFGVLWPFGSMHRREVLAAGGGGSSDIVHVILGVATVLLTLTAVGLGTRVFGRGFRIYSLVTIVVQLVFGVLMGVDGPRMAANLPTPWMGLWERINIAGFLLWVIVLAVILARSGRSARAADNMQAT